MSAWNVQRHKNGFIIMVSDARSAQVLKRSPGFMHVATTSKIKGRNPLRLRKSHVIGFEFFYSDPRFVKTITDMRAVVVPILNLTAIKYDKHI